MPADRRQRLEAIGFEWDPFAAIWEQGCFALEQFKAREGHCGVPTSHAEGEFKLGSWVSHQRRRRDTMPSERRQRLEAIGFEWDALASDWETGFSALERFRAREGHCRVPKGHVEGEFRLGSWVIHRRSSSEDLPTERRQRLEGIGFLWDLYASDWDRGLAALERFRAREGHCRAPRGHVEGEFKLGSWIGRQRNAERTMPAERRQRLEAIGFEWDPLAVDWERGFAALEKFKAREGHCRAPQGHVEGEFKLGSWVGSQRNAERAMPSERRQQLEAIGFEWDPHSTDWDRGLAALEKFKAREGHCGVPQVHVEGTFKLGSWVSHQRRRRDTMPAERRQRLEAIGFEWAATRRSRAAGT